MCFSTVLSSSQTTSLSASTREAASMTTQSYCAKKVRFGRNPFEKLMVAEIIDSDDNKVSNSENGGIQ